MDCKKPKEWSCFALLGCIFAELQVAN